MDGLFVVSVDNLPEDFDELEAEQLGEEFGYLREAWLDETSRGWTAFLVYADLRAALEAVDGLNNEEIDGLELRARIIQVPEEFADDPRLDRAAMFDAADDENSGVMSIFAEQSNPELDELLDDDDDDLDHDDDLGEEDDTPQPGRSVRRPGAA